MPQQQASVRPPLVQPPAADSTTNPQVQVILLIKFEIKAVKLMVDGESQLNPHF